MTPRLPLCRSMVQPNAPEPIAIPDGASPSAMRTGAIASLVALWWTIGGEIALLVLVAFAVVVSPLFAVAVAVAGLTLIDTAGCVWLDRHWDEWVTKSGDRAGRTLERMRSNDFLRRVVGWMTGTSPLRFVIAAVVTSPITTVCIVRLGGGATIGPSRILSAALANAVVVGVLAALAGYLVNVVRGG